jgi:glucose-6-phosphate isomerase
MTTTTTTTTTTNQFRKIILDYSRQQVTGETMELLFDLADAVNFTERREAMRTGERINTTEDKPVLHHLLRTPPPLSPKPVAFGVRQTSMSGVNTAHHTTNPNASRTREIDSILDEIHAVRRQIESFSNKVRTGDIRGVTGQPLVDTVVVSASSGGLHLGSKFVHRAMSADQTAAQNANGRRLHFLSNIDPVDTYLTTNDLDPARTLVVVISKDFANSNEMLNLRSIRHWLTMHLCTKDDNSDNGEKNDNNNSGIIKFVNPKRKQSITEAKVMERHVVAVTCPGTSNYQHMGISSKSVFPIWDWVIGRFSVCSAVGVLPLSLQYGYDIVCEFLNGAHDMDEHFFTAPLRDNIPVLLGLLGVWNSTFMGYTTRAILPFSEALSAFPAHVQLIDMESNGKRVAIDGVELFHPSGEIDFGETAGNSHHPFYQLMHQGRVVPADFIGFMESPRPVELPGEAVSSHDEFMSNFFAQPDALAYGKSLVDLIQEGVPDGLREHMVFPGNRPSSSILMTRLDPFSIGQLLALYEHRTAVQGFLWGINSFDQYGLEMGKLLAKYIRVQLAASRRTGATVQGFNQSTSSLLEAYLAHGKQSK